MASIGSITPQIFVNGTRKVYDRKISKWTPIMGVHKELLPMVCLRQNQQKVLTKSQTVKKRQDPQK